MTSREQCSQSSRENKQEQQRFGQRTKAAMRRRQCRIVFGPLIGMVKIAGGKGGRSESSTMTLNVGRDLQALTARRFAIFLGHASTRKVCM